MINKSTFHLLLLLERFKDLVAGTCKSLLVHAYKIYIFFFSFVDNIVDIYRLPRSCVLKGEENIYLQIVLASGISCSFLIKNLSLSRQTISYGRKKSSQQQQRLNL